MLEDLCGYAKANHFENCINYGNVTGNTTVGGIAGAAMGALSAKNCYNYGTITGLSNVGDLVGIEKGMGGGSND